MNRPLHCAWWTALGLTLALGALPARADDDDNAPPALDGPSAPGASGAGRPGMGAPGMGLPGGGLPMGPGPGGPPGGAPPAAPEPPPEEGPTPADTATAEVNVVGPTSQATLRLLNPHNSGAPLWLWLLGHGGPGAEARILDPDDRVLWRGGLQALAPQGELVVVPRPASLMSHAVKLQVVEGNTPPRTRELSLGHPRLSQLSLPLLVVGDVGADAYAEKLRARAPDRIIHTIPAASLPKAPAAYLGVSAVVVGQGVTVDPKAGLALRLFHCARGGVASLGALSLPPHGACPDPPQLTGNGGAPTADALLQGLREFQASLGILEERGPPGFFGGAYTDAQAASALLLSRPPARLGVILLLVVLALMVLGMQLTRSWRPVRALLALGGLPVLAGLAIAGVGQAFAGGETVVRLISADVRAKAPVALVRMVEVRRGRAPVPTSPTAWVSVLEPPLEDGLKSQALITETVDVMDVPQPVEAVVDPKDANAMAVRRLGGDPVTGHSCREPGTVTEGSRVSRALGQMLLDRCVGQRGVVAPLPAEWIPGVAPLLEPGATGEAAWIHVFGGAP